MSWPSTRVDAIYKAIIQRETVEHIEQQRLTITSAVFSNPTWDEPGNNRKQYLEELNQGFNRAIELVYYPEGRPGERIDWNKPWFAAAKRGLAKTQEKLEWIKKQQKMGEAVQISQEQLEARKRSREQIDQQ